MQKQKPLNLKLMWRLYLLLGKDKIEKDGVVKGLSTVSFSDFSEMLVVFNIKGKNIGVKQLLWNKMVKSVNLESFSKIIRELFYAD